jgi:uncharacterized protein YbjQ (UPF0145 family)/ferredoxin
VCPTGASYKRAEDGIVLVDYDKCIGCKYCSWACPYGARELDEKQKVMKKCTLCVDRIYTQLRGRPPAGLVRPAHRRAFRRPRRPDRRVETGRRTRRVALMPELGYAPVNATCRRAVPHGRRCGERHTCGGHREHGTLVEPTPQTLKETQMAKDNDILVTTTPGFEGRRIVDYKGLVGGDAILGANMFRDLFAGLRDLVGGRSGSYENLLRAAKTEPQEDMIAAARERGANAVVGVDLDYETIQIQDGGSMLMVSCSGTAVVIE